MDYDILIGKGKYIFFLHGWGGDKNSFNNIKNYVSHLNRNMVFVSFAGFGQSDPPSKVYGAVDYANELKDLIVKIAKGKSVDIVCHSFGGRVATVLAALYPNIVNKILMIDIAGVKPKRSIKKYINILKYKRLKKLVLQGKKDKNLLKNFGSDDYKNIDGVMRQTFVKIVNEDLKMYFKQIKCSVVIFWGAKDKDTPLYMAKKIKKWVKNSVLYIAETAGHFSYIDAENQFYPIFYEFMLKSHDKIV